MLDENAIIFFHRVLASVCYLLCNDVNCLDFSHKKVLYGVEKLKTVFNKLASRVQTMGHEP
jgi:hypothetical protein